MSKKLKLSLSITFNLIYIINRGGHIILGGENLARGGRTPFLPPPPWKILATPLLGLFNYYPSFIKFQTHPL